MKSSANLLLPALLSTLLIAAVSAQSPTVQSPQNALSAVTSASYGSIPLSFEANQGQTDPSVQYLSHGQGYTLFLRPGEAALALKAAEPASGKTAADFSFIRMELAGSNPQAAVSQEEPQITRTNYFLGNDPKKWRTNIPNYGRVRYSSIYPGIDLVYYGNRRRLEHDFVVAPNADPAKIVFTLEGAGKLRVDPATGDLVLPSAGADLRLLKPVTYQESNGRRTEISSSYKLLAGNRVRFSVGPYDHTRQLVIDPILAYSTFVGGSGGDTGNAITVDASGNAYVAGSTLSVDFPVTGGAYQSAKKTPANFPTAFISKLNPSGTALVYSTYLGGSHLSETFSGGDSANAIAVDSNGNAYVAGSTRTTDFPTVNPFQSTLNSVWGNAFVTKLSADGSSLVYSTYLGGNDGNSSTSDQATSIAIDSSGDAYVTGSTQSTNFPVTTGALQTTYPTVFYAFSCYGGTAFVSELNPAGGSLVFSTYLGGTHGESAHGIAVDASSNIYIAGATTSPDFPATKGAFQTANPEGNFCTSTGFVAKLHAGGASLDYATYLGGTNSFYAGVPNGESVNGIAIDSSGNAYVAGVTPATDFPITSTAVQKEPGIYYFTGFAAKLNSTGASLSHATYLGGQGTKITVGYIPTTGDIVNGIGIDSSGNSYVTGTTISSNFPVTTGAFQQLNFGSSSFLTELNSTDSALLYSAFLGDSSTAASSIAVTGSGNAYVSGSTASIDFPISSTALQTAPLSANPTVFITALNPGSSNTGAGTTTALTSSQPFQFFGDPVTLTAKVAAVGSSTVPTGSLDFIIDGVSTSTATLDGSGKATYTTSSLSANSHTVVANYGGSSTSGFSTSSLTQIAFKPSVYALYGSNQGTIYGTAFPQQLTAIGLANWSNTDAPLPAGQTITFSGAGLSFSPSSVSTPSNGQVSTTVTPTRTGNLTATASVANGISAATFSLICFKAPLYIQALNVHLTYGQVPTLPLAYTLHGFVNGDTQATATTGAPALTTTATSSTPVGFYPIGVGIGTLSAPNYYFNTTYSGMGSVEIFKAQLYIQAKNVKVVQGHTPVLPLAYNLIGFVNGETQATATTGQPSLTTTVTATSPPGFYPIAVGVGTLSAPNYQIHTTYSGMGTVQVVAP